MVSRYPGEDAVLGSHEVGNWNCSSPNIGSQVVREFPPFPSSPDGVTCFEGTNRTILRTLADGKGDRMEGSVAKNFEERKSHEHFLEVGHHARNAAPFCRF